MPIGLTDKLAFESIIVHLVTLRILMEESCFRCKGLYCSFVEFRKAFDMVPRERLWKCIEKLDIPSKYMQANSPIYETVIYWVHMGVEFSDFSNTLLVVCKDAHTHKLHLIYGLMD